MKWKVGDRVVVVESKRGSKGIKGTIFYANSNKKEYGVEFDESIVGCHNGDGKHKDGHCWYYESGSAYGKSEKILVGLYDILVKYTRKKRKNNYY